MPLDEATRRFSYLLQRDLRRMATLRDEQDARGEEIKFDSVTRIAVVQTKRGDAVSRLHGEVLATYTPYDRILRWAWAGRSPSAPSTYGDVVFREGQARGVPQLYHERGGRPRRGRRGHAGEAGRAGRPCRVGACAEGRGRLSSSSACSNRTAPRPHGGDARQSLLGSASPAARRRPPHAPASAAARVPIDSSHSRGLRATHTTARASSRRPPARRRPGRISARPARRRGRRRPRRRRS